MSQAQVKAQEAEDRKLAFREQLREVQLSGKHARDDRPHDSQGDDVMDDASGDEAADSDWQEQRRPCRRADATSSATQAARKSTSPTRPSSGVEEAAATPSATAQPSAQVLGPLATAPRGRAQDRDRTPRMAKASGTLATAPAAGSLQEPSATVSSAIPSS